MSTISIERTNFSSRLTGALSSARGLAASPTVLAREFNRFFDGKPITVHAARKWLLGEAIPTQDKLQALANWLEVSVEWLRFGDTQTPDAAGGADNQPPLTAKTEALLRLYMGLPHRERAMARQFISMLARQHRQAAESRTTAPEQITQS